MLEDSLLSLGGIEAGVELFYANHRLDTERRELSRDREPITVEPQVFDLLVFLIENRDRVVSKDDLIAGVWGGRIVSDSTLTSRINAARRAIGDSGERQALIRTYARKGIRFVGEVREGNTPAASKTAQPSNAPAAAAILAAAPAGPGAPVDPGDGAALRRLALQRDVITGFIVAHRGQILASADEHILARFTDLSDAVSAASDFQRELGARNAPLPESARLLFGVGIAIEGGGRSGSPEGDGARLAVRIAEAAGPGAVCVSGEVRARAAMPPDLWFTDTVAGKPADTAQPLRIYRVHSNAPAAVAGFTETGGRPSVAVLPLNNLSGDPQQDYFADGITEDIITALSKHRSLVVIARNSAFAFKDHGTDVRRVGVDLGADYVVEGSVRRIDQRVRITVQLVETDGGRHIWAERYDRSLDDIFEMQDEITAAVAARIEPEVGTAERLRTEKKPAQALHAWDFFRLGTKHFYRPTIDDNREAQRLFRRAIELNAELAEAYGFLSYAIVLSMVYFDVPPDPERLNEAVAIAKKGVELDDQDALIRFMYGRALLASRAYGHALSELEIALDLNPNLAVVYCGLGDSLAYEGKPRDAIPYFEKAIKLSPYDPQRWAFYSYRSLAHLFAHEFEPALEWAQKATRIPNCHYWAFSHRVAALGHLGRADDIRLAIAELMQRNPDFSCRFARERLFYLKDPAQIELYVEGLGKAGVRI
ncbi:MAG: tetratricopeptide repeat protein [Alphaproteobacteria bacterium]|nr:tetratricopeptide repeat protein [Alphaproteobacteria bacterium]